MKKIFLVLTILILICGCSIQDKKQKETELDKIIKMIDGEAYVDTFTLYGRFFNLGGEVSLDAENLSLILKKADKEYKYDLITEEKDGKIAFKTNQVINEGINLEHIDEGNYVILLKGEKVIEDSETEEGEEPKVETLYYTLVNRTEYPEIEYYTITKNSENKKILIDYDTYKDYNYLGLTANKEKLPTEVYDIVIDPGHGGDDPGATKNGQYESKMNLDYALKLKESLENLGLKVKLTRETDETLPNYGDGSRVNVAYETRTKMFLSIHQNSAYYNVGEGGVEVYIPYNASKTFAMELAKNIVENTSTIYSTNKQHKIDKGVYLRTLTSEDILDMKKSAEKDGYTPYERASTNSTYYFMIRETGGIVSGAYVDLRNPKKPGNTYYNSNYGSEAYLLEMGYMSSSTNLNILLNEKDKYVEAITNTLKEYLEI